MHTGWLHHTIIIIQINIRKQDTSSVRFIFRVKINLLHYTHNHTYIYIATLASQLYRYIDLYTIISNQHNTVTIHLFQLYL